MANVIQQLNKPTLIIAHNKTLAAQLYSEFKEFFPNNAVEYLVSYYAKLENISLSIICVARRCKMSQATASLLWSVLNGHPLDVRHRRENGHSTL